MTRLTHYARGSFVAIAALALTAGGAFAAGGFAPASSHHSDHVVTTNVESTDALDATEATEAVDATEATEAAEAPDAPEAPDTSDTANAARPHNHGWFVSQAAQLPTPTGFANRGAYMSSIAQGTDGKPAGAANGAAKAAAGKAKGAAARAGHSGGH